MLTGSIQIVCDREVFRRGLSTVLSDAGFSIIGEFRTILQMPQLQSRQTPDLLLAVTNEDSLSDDAVRDLAAARTAMPATRQVVLAFPQAASNVPALARCGVDAIISATATPDVLCRTLELVLMGQKIAPIDWLHHAAQHCRCTALAAQPASGSPQGSGGTSFGRLSSRENQVLSSLKQGLSNREIAYSLEISEATVKMHVKILMRKRNVKNRTQLAILGLTENHGPITTPDRKLPAPRVTLGLRGAETLAG